jgi:threonine aldolase
LFLKELPMRIIDLRSDTVTLPTPEMREAMARAEVGDDVYGEDPTVNRLQEMAAERMGQEAGLFVASGTMGNLVAILTHCRRGDEAIVGNLAHTFLYEAGGMSALGGVHSCQLPNQSDGSLRIEDIEAAIRPDDPHDPVTRLICLENTHNRCGGTFQTPRYLAHLTALARARGLAVHLDGARLFNAAAAQGIPAKDLTAGVNSVTFCLSKGLCAPAGSVLCGSRDFIARALRLRKMLGGGMRQAGILAAAGIVALESMAGRLAEDHARARQLADGLRTIPGLVLADGTPATNMVFLSLDPALKADAQAIAARLRSDGILVGVTGERSFRLVTHYWVGDADIESAAAGFRKILR